MAETETVVYSVHINATQEAVWAELTKTDEPQDAFWHTVLHTTGLEPGSSYQMRTPDGRYVNAIGEILEYEPPNRLKQTVRFARSDDPPVTATYEITEAAQGGVNLIVTVEDIPTGTKSGKGWKGSGGVEFIAKTVKQVVEHGQASVSTRVMYRFFDLIGSLGNPKRTAVEHWPLDRSD
jgi:uncharacterized protein YndB with AHSA1/START domain